MNRNICSAPCCIVITKRLCNTCAKVSACKSHKTCVACKTARKIEQSDPLSKDYLYKKAARDKYRAKMGIPLDAPLCPRGGARHIVNHDEETKALMEEKAKAYQTEYQAEYRKKMRVQKMYNDLIKLKQIVMMQLQDPDYTNKQGAIMYLDTLNTQINDLCK